MGTRPARAARLAPGLALALPRIVAALLENNQTTDGIRLPKALHSYCGFEKRSMGRAARSAVF